MMWKWNARWEPKTNSTSLLPRRVLYSAPPDRKTSWKPALNSICNHRCPVYSGTAYACIPSTSYWDNPLNSAVWYGYDHRESRKTNKSAAPSTGITSFHTSASYGVSGQQDLQEPARTETA